jgi:methyl-accepting chemotaxis protein
MVDDLREMADVATHVSTGDLTVEVRRRSERDALGVAFARLGENLRGIVSDTPRAPGAWRRSAHLT